MMIPKIIHYCWFGRAPLDNTAQKCIESWKKFFPDYKIVCWNEDNFDVTQLRFSEEAYKQEKWAFVSDVARLIILYQNGGFYFDTDVEVIAPYSDILAEAKGGYFGFEVTNYVATGLGFAAEKGNPFILELINTYKQISFSENIAALSTIACPIIMTKLMEEQGYIAEDKKQSFRGFQVYPTEYFSPLNYDTGKLRLTKRTHSIHWGNASWNEDSIRQEHFILQKYNRFFGKNLGEKMYGIHSCIKREGFMNYVKRHF